MAEYRTTQQFIGLVKSLEVVLGCLGVSVLTRETERLPDCWVSVKDRLPERNEKVLAIVRLPGEEEYIGENKYKGPLVGTKRKVWDIHGDYVTHWMPLPEPPKE